MVYTIKVPFISDIRIKVSCNVTEEEVKNNTSRFTSALQDLLLIQLSLYDLL